MPDLVDILSDVAIVLRVVRRMQSNACQRVPNDLASACPLVGLVQHDGVKVPGGSLWDHEAEARQRWGLHGTPGSGRSGLSHYRSRDESGRSELSHYRSVELERDCEVER